MYEQQRLHPVSIIDFLVRNIYSLLQGLLPLIILAFAREGIRIWLLVAIPALCIIFIVYAIIYWHRYVFYVNEQELRLEYGVFIRKKRYIPFERIQTFQISAGILQRIFGLVKVQVETAGGGNEAEFLLSALSRQKAETLRDILKVGGKKSEPMEDEPNNLEYRLSTRSLLLLASTSNGIGVAISALLVVITQLDDYFSRMDIWIKIGHYAENLAAGRISMIILAVFILLFFAWILSLIGSIIRFGNFRVVREGENIKISRGLLERHQITLPIKRIQAIKLVEGILRQPFGMMSIQVISISNMGTKGEGNVLFPLLSRSQLDRFVEDIIPEYAMTMETNKLPARSRNRYLAVNIIPALIIAILLTVFIPWGFLALLIIPLAAWLGNTQYIGAGWQLNGNKLLLRYRIIGRVTTIVLRQKIQSLDISQNLFQKRISLTNMSIAVASNITAAIIKVRGMDETSSKLLLKWVSNV